MEEFKCRGYAGDVPVYCAHDKIVPVSEVKPNPKNPNQHPEEQIELLAKIIKTQGWRAPITVSTLSGLVVRGHGRLMAAQHLGLDCVPVDFQQYKSMDAELADLLADNKIAELAEIDAKMLAEVFQDIDPDAIDIDVTGYSEEEYNDIISALMDATAPEPGELDEDDPVEVQETAVSALGDVWQLGKHRLMCGSATSKDDVLNLTENSKIDLIYTDPPYGMNAVSKSGVLSKHYKTDIMGDDDNSVAISAFVLAEELYKSTSQIWWGANYYTECLPSSECWIVWDKNNGASDQTDCELAWTNFRSVVRQFTMASEKTNRVHPTQKPVKLFCEIVSKFDKDNKIKNVLDLFGGSGSTLIACEQLKNTCYLMELDPRYVDVIVKRYIGVTGKTDVVLLRDGEQIPVENTGILD